MIIEFALTTTLQAFQENVKFGIYFPGMLQGILFSSFMDRPDVNAIVQFAFFSTEQAEAKKISLDLPFTICLSQPWFNWKENMIF